MLSNGAELDQLDLEFIAEDVIQSYMAPFFDIPNTKFEILSTIRYDPYLDVLPGDEDRIGQPPKSPQATDMIYKCSVPQSELLSPPNTRTVPPSQFFLFDEHYHRLRLALSFFQWPFEITEEFLLWKLNQALRDLDLTLPYKCRVLINKRGILEVQISPTLARSNLMEGFYPDTTPDRIWSVYVDSKPIPISPFTSFKTTKRDHYDEARKRSGNPHELSSDVLVFNEAHQVMEGTFTNILFKRSKLYPSTGKIVERWVTPPLSSGCLCGVTRHMLISKNLIEEEPVKLSEVVPGETVLLFNGIIGVVKGIIKF